MLYNILKLSRGEEKERCFLAKENLEIVSEAISFDNESFFINEEPNLDYLSESNIKCLDEAIKKVNSMDFNNIVLDTHGDEWKKAYNSENKYMDNLNIAKEGEASDCVIEYLKEALEWDKKFA